MGAIRYNRDRSLKEAVAFGWEQSRLNEAVQILLERSLPNKIPYIINKKLYFVALRAMAATIKKDGYEIARDLSRVIIAKRKDGSTKAVPIGWVIAAKRAGKAWPEVRMRLGEKRKSGRQNRQRAWLAFLERYNRNILMSRSRAAGFLRVGWLSAAKDMSPYVKNKSGAPATDTGGARLRGASKGNAKPAQPGLTVTGQIENTAQAKSDKRNGLVRIGGPALDRAYRDELADFLKYLESEGLAEEVAKFNASQK